MQLIAIIARFSFIMSVIGETPTDRTSAQKKTCGLTSYVTGPVHGVAPRNALCGLSAVPLANVELLCPVRCTRRWPAIKLDPQEVRSYIHFLGRAVKIRDVIDIIEKDGWHQVYQRGSHRQFKHARQPGRVTIAGHPNDDLAPGTLGSIFKQASVKKPRKK